MSDRLLLNERSLAFVAYWRALERPGRMARLPDLFDRPDSQIHPWLNIVDVDQEANQPIRFAGTSVIGYFGADLTRTNFLDILSPQSRPIIQHTHREIVGRPCGAFHNSVCSTATGRDIELHATGLPFMRSNGLACVAWLLTPDKTLTYGEDRILVQRVVEWTWIDLGFGVPQS
jgi:hypothetical protein